MNPSASPEKHPIPYGEGMENTGINIPLVLMRIFYHIAVLFCTGKALGRRGAAGDGDGGASNIVVNTMLPLYSHNSSAILKIQVISTIYVVMTLETSELKEE